jgi:selenocysteine-specific elongation factor
MIVGTAGHIDHGKTTLVKALTGVDADRLPEEKARGITLDLGYAYTPLASGGTLGFVDVPGHEKLIHNMLAGATGIDFVLLVVAADDGPMPQTREHLEIVELLGLTRGAVAITKCDAAAPERLTAAEAEVRAMLATTGLRDAPLFQVSAISGEGIPALRAHLESVAGELDRRDDTGRFRLAIDRCFSLAGVGTVVTGTVFSGRVSVGDTVAVAPAGLRGKVRGLHVQDRPADSGGIGQRCAVNLTGDFDRQAIVRGMWLLDPALLYPTRRIGAELRVLPGAPPLRHWSQVHLHHGAADIVGRVGQLEQEELAPGQSGLAELILDQPLCTVRGDRLVLRDASARHTLAGGRVLDLFPPTRHRRAPERLAYLRALSVDTPRVALELATRQQPAGVDLERYAINWNLTAEAANALWRQAGLVTVETVTEHLGFAAEGWTALAERLLAALAAEHERAADMPGVDRDRLRRLTAAHLSRAAFDRLLEPLLAAGRVVRSGSWLHLPGHRVQVSAEDAALWQRLRPLLDATPYGPPRVRDIAGASGLAEEAVRALFKRLARAGDLYPVAHDHYFTAEAVGGLAAIVAGIQEQTGTARAAALRDRIGGGRKVAIHILEFFDRVGYTRRVRDEHVLRGAATQSWTQS